MSLKPVTPLNDSGTGVPSEKVKVALRTDRQLPCASVLRCPSTDMASVGI